MELNLSQLALLRKMVKRSGGWSTRELSGPERAKAHVLHQTGFLEASFGAGKTDYFVSAVGKAYLTDYPKRMKKLPRVQCVKELMKSTYTSPAFVLGKEYKVLEESERDAYVLDEQGNKFGPLVFLADGVSYVFGDYFERALS